jgi:hypothetical protein
MLYPSKEFVLSRESLRGNLKEINQNQPANGLAERPTLSTKKLQGEKDRERERERER